MKRLFFLVIVVLLSGSSFAQGHEESAPVDRKVGHYPLRDGLFTATDFENFPFLFHVEQREVSSVVFGHFLCEEIAPTIYDCSTRDEDLYFSLALSEDEVVARRSVPGVEAWHSNEKLELKTAPILLEWKKPYPKVKFMATPEGIVVDCISLPEE